MTKTQYYGYLIKRNPGEFYEMMTLKGGEIPVVTDKDPAQRAIRRVLSIKESLEEVALMNLTPLIERGIMDRRKLRVIG